LIEIKAATGTFVKSVSAMQLHFPLSTAMLTNKQDIAHLLEVRKIIEVGAAASAAIHRSEQDLQAMLQILENVKQAHG
ncbi:FadR/GntR family transcriptional regulator, partial [Lysinibacillus fusiformis]|uniref:FadR/GntR family transcriptional regulator n=1 Tax=Lysinibacillus fusiformis TaxID=28031 RepID=UPI0030B9C5E2